MDYSHYTKEDFESVDATLLQTASRAMKMYADGLDNIVITIVSQLVKRTPVAEDFIPLKLVKPSKYPADFYEIYFYEVYYHEIKIGEIRSHERGIEFTPDKEFA